MPLLHHLALVLRLHAAVPSLDLVDAYAHVAAAEDAATGQVSAEVLLAIAYTESRFDATATSRVEGKKRHTGHYASTTAPAQLNKYASLYCGPLQTFAGSWDECLGLRALPAAYRAGADELEKWLRDPRVHGDLALALAGHGCGNFGVITRKCNAYPERVLWVARRLTVPTPTS